MYDTEWGGLQPRRWQAEALAAIEARDDDRGLVVAFMGAGKSVLLAELAARTAGRIVVTAPTLRLVHQLAATLERRGLDVGKVCTGHDDTTHRVTVTTYAARSLAIVADAIPAPALWIADEAHRTSTTTCDHFVAAIQPQRSIGFTATPYRAEVEISHISDPERAAEVLRQQRLTYWQAEWYAYRYEDAIRDGVVHVPTFAGPQLPRDLLAASRADEMIVELVDACARWLDMPEATGPGVFSQPSRADADSLADALAARGYAVEAFHSDHSMTERDSRIERLRSGELRAIVHVACLVEGVDLPWLRWIGLTNPRGSRVAYAQEIGRVLRTAPDKPRAYVWDPFDSASVHQIQSPTELEGALGDDDKPELARPIRWALICDDERIVEVNPNLQSVELAALGSQAPVAYRAEVVETCETCERSCETLTCDLAEGQIKIRHAIRYRDATRDGLIAYRLPKRDDRIEDYREIPTMTPDERTIRSIVMVLAAYDLAPTIAEEARERIPGSPKHRRWVLESPISRKNRSWLDKQITPMESAGSDVLRLIASIARQPIRNATYVGAGIVIRAYRQHGIAKCTAALDSAGVRVVGSTVREEVDTDAP